MIVDEAYGPCSLAAEIAAQVADTGFDDLDAPVARVNSEFVLMPYAEDLEHAVLPSADKVMQAVKDVLYRT